MRVISLAGSPSPHSRSAALMAEAHARLRERGITVRAYGVHDFPAEDLLQGRFDSPAVLALVDELGRADGVIVGTPVYKASYSGVLKALLDLLPERVFADKVLLPFAVGGSPAHMLVLDYALRPVLAALKAQEILHGVYALDSQIIRQETRVVLEPVLTERLQHALGQFELALARRRSGRLAALDVGEVATA